MSQDSHTNARRPSPAKHWSFTIFFQEGHMPLLQQKNAIEANAFIEQYDFCMQLEQCPNTQRQHLQGCIRFSEKRRPKTLFTTMLGHDTTHFESSKGSWASNVRYCSKNATRIDGPWSNVPVPEELRLVTPDRVWQSDLLDTLLAPVTDDRTILWYADTQGGVGMDCTMFVDVDIDLF